MGSTHVVVDFGAQHAQLIARRVRECHVYSEIVPSTMTAAELLAKKPKAIILSGGPSSVYAEGAPPAPEGLLDAGVPIFGLCYGFQLMVARLLVAPSSATASRNTEPHQPLRPPAPARMPRLGTPEGPSGSGCPTGTPPPRPRPASP